jgi:hypothetical protein
MKNSDRPTGRAAHQGTPLSSLPKRLTLIYTPGGEEKIARAMEAWVQDLADEAGGRLVFGDTPAEDQLFLPALSVRTGASSSVHYHFVPEGPEIPVFRDFLWEVAAKGDSERNEPAAPGQPGPRREMLLFVSTHCPNCPRAVRTVQALAWKLPNLAAHLFEAMQHTDLAERHTVLSVPTLLVDREIRYVGSLDEGRLISILRSEDPDALLHEKIRQQIKGGSALDAAEWIAAGGDPSFLVPDLGKSTFEERIALLLALEEALEADPRCLDRMVDPLLPCLETGDASVRGDIADLLGKIGDRRALPALKKLCRDPDPNVVEAATEAVEALEQAGPQL